MDRADFPCRIGSAQYDELCATRVDIAVAKFPFRDTDRRDPGDSSLSMRIGDSTRRNHRSCEIDVLSQVTRDVLSASLSVTALEYDRILRQQPGSGRTVTPRQRLTEMSSRSHRRLQSGLCSSTLRIRQRVGEPRGNGKHNRHRDYCLEMRFHLKHPPVALAN